MNNTETPRWKRTLSNFKFIADFITSLAPIIKFLLVAAGVFVLTMVVSDFKAQTLATKHAQEIQQYKKDAQLALNLSEQTKRDYQKVATEIVFIQDSNLRLQKQIAATQRSATMNKKAADSLKTELAAASTVYDSLSMTLKIIDEQDSIIKKQDTTNTLKDIQINQLRIINQKQDTTIKNLLFVTDSLEKTIKNVPIPSPCQDKFLFCQVNKPSRKTAFYTGVVVGVIGTAIIVDKVTK